LHPKIIHGSLINHTYTKIIPDIYEFKYRQNRKGHMSKIIPARGTKMIPVHPKIIHGSLISHTSTKTNPDIYEIKYGQNRKGHMSKIIPAQGKNYHVAFFCFAYI